MLDLERDTPEKAPPPAGAAACPPGDADAPPETETESVPPQPEAAWEELPAGTAEEGGRTECAPEPAAAPATEESPAPDGAAKDLFDPQRQKELHDQAVADAAEEAKDRSLYESYFKTSYAQAPDVVMFGARRRGRSHVRKGLPCQDYCCTAAVGRCVVMAAADGVGSCARSDVGSRLACEAVIDVLCLADQSCGSEQELVNRLCGIKFRERLVRKWIGKVLAQLDGESEQFRALQAYGSTLMFAVITENWYIAGSLGDGQVLLFNDRDSVKLRVHRQKESSRVRALVNERCYLEDFQVERYPRACFDGVLLSTDGMYDVLSRGMSFYAYALQIRARFQEADEPLQPFCYQEPDAPLKDLSRFRTSDDCTILLAVDRKPGKPLSEAVRRVIDQTTQSAVLQRKHLDVSLYLTQTGKLFQTVVVSPAGRIPAAPAALRTAELILPGAQWEMDGFAYSVYHPALGDEMMSLELLYNSGLLRGQRGDLAAACFPLDVYQMLLACQRELEQMGLTLNGAAHFLVWFDPDRRGLRLCREAISPLEQSNDPVRPAVWQYFESLIGFLEWNGKRLPLFSTGYVSLGRHLPRLDTEEPQQMCRVEKAEDGYRLQNIGDHPWRLYSGETVAPGGSAPLENGLEILVQTSTLDSFERYHYYTKESL